MSTQRIMHPSISDDLFAEMGMPRLFEYTGIRFNYRPLSGSPRHVEAICLYEEVPPRDDEVGESRQERLWLSVSRDPIEGIDDPRLGDSGLRDGDSPDSPWSFQGEIRNESAHAWELLFARIRPMRYGPRTAT